MAAHIPSTGQLKSASAISRFLNRYQWPTRQVIRLTRRRVVNHLLSQRPKGRRPHLQVIIDLTCLPKRGKFKQLGSLIRVFNRKRGLQLVVLYLVVGPWRLPWNWRIYRGKGQSTQVQLALRMIRALSRRLRKHYQLIILTDSAFGSREFLHEIRRLKCHAVVGTTRSRTLADGRRLDQLANAGQQHYLNGMRLPVYVSWYYLKRDDSTRVKRYIVSTRRLKRGAIYFWGRRRWQIEGWFQNCQASLWTASLWPVNSDRDLPLPRALHDCLCLGSLGLAAGQFYSGLWIGARRPKTRLSCSFLKW